MTKRRNGEGFIREKPGRPGLWEIRISITQDDGTRIQKSFYERSYEAAEHKLQNLRRANKSGKLIASRSPKLGDWLKEWLTVVLPHADLKLSTVENYRAMFRGRLESDHLMKRSLEKLRERDIEDFLIRLNGRGLSASSRRVCLTVLRQALDAALRRSLIGFNPAANVSRPKSEATVRQWLKLSDVRDILWALSSSKYLPPALLMALSGMRRGEVLGLRWSDVDFYRSQVTIRSTLNRVNGKLTLTSPKTANSRRVIHMTAEITSLLRQVHSETSFTGNDDFVFQTSNGDAVDPRAMLRAFQKAARKVGIEHANLHDLRHAAASAMLNSGVPLFTVSKTLGHSSVAVTGDVYGHLLDSAQIEAMNTLSTGFRESVMVQISGTTRSCSPASQIIGGLTGLLPLDPQSSALPSCATARTLPRQPL